MTMQALVMAHAAFGHNHFFKNNYLFRQWTDAEGILDYLAFAKNYIAACEERLRPRGGRGDARLRARADGPGRVPLSPRRQAQPRASTSGAARERAEYEEEPTTTSGARCPPRRAADAETDLSEDEAASASAA